MKRLSNTEAELQKSVTYKKKSIYIFLSTITLQFLFHFRGRKRLLLFNGVLFAQEIPNFWSENQTCVKKSYLFHELGDMKG